MSQGETQHLGTYEVDYVINESVRHITLVGVQLLSDGMFLDFQDAQYVTQFMVSAYNEPVVQRVDSA